MEEIKKEAEQMLRSIISDDYVNDIFSEILNDIVLDVVETSSYEEDGTWNDDDIKLAI